MAEIDVPIIDIAPFYGDDEAARKKVVEELADACARCGFFMIRGHRVPVEVIDACWKHCKEFFDGPLSIKEAINMAEDYPYGYSGLGTEIAGGSYDYGAADKKECVAFCLGPDGVADPRMPTPRWPAAPGGFKGAVTAYYREMESLARVLLRIMALALQQPEDFFDTYEDKHWSALRCLNYPHSDKPFSPGQMRIAAHTDYGSLTILRADNTPGGLQVQMKDGSWRDVNIPADCFTINLGDLMQRWTNDRWKSTMHRVVPPPVDKVGPDGLVPENRRQSVAFFHNLNRDAVCSVFPSCVDEAHPCLYEPISAFEHLMSRHAKATGMKKHLASAEGAAEGDAAAAPSGGAGASAAPAAKIGGADITGAAWAKADGK